MVGKYRSEVGNYLKNIRKNKNITAKALGENLKYSQSHISGIENGSKKIPPFFIPAYLNFISDTNEEYNYYAEQITKITEGNFEVEKRRTRHNNDEILNSISKHGRMREFYTYDYNNNKVVTVFSEEFLESIRYDHVVGSLDTLTLQDKIEEIQNVFKKN